MDTLTFSTLPTEIFFISTFLLLCGLTMEIWTHGVRLSLLSRMKLSVIEREHPYIPSIRIIMGIGFCSVALLLTTIHLFGGSELFDQGDWLYPAVFFSDVCALLILAELKGGGAREYAFAFTTTSAAVLTVFVLMGALKTLPPATTFFLLSLTAACAALAWDLFQFAWSRRMRIVAGITLVGWILAYALWQ